MINFCAGPSKLPDVVYNKLPGMIRNYQATGLSLLSISHRDPIFLETYYGIKRCLQKLLNLSENYAILLMPGGATAQFSAIPLNLGKLQKAAYFNSGYWSSAAIKEARKFTQVSAYAVGDAILEQGSFDYIHYTENETIEGFQWQEAPNVDAPLVGDFSSSFLSNPIDVDRHHVIYAGAQKNIGLPSVAVVIIHKTLLSERKQNIPILLDYAAMDQANSLYNTPNVIAWVVMELVLKDILDQGGLIQVAQKNQKKAMMLYQAIDQSGLFYNNLDQKNRSNMNVVFQLHDKPLTEKFLRFARNRGIYGLNGHRSVGGCRASLYNAVSLEDVKQLIQVMNEFEDDYRYHN